MSKIILVNPAWSTVGYGVITPRWLFVIAKATPRDLAGDPGGTVGYLIGGYVVRHHAAENVGSGFSFVPVVDVSTHTCGANIELLPPDMLEMAKVSRLINRMRLK